MCSARVDMQRVKPGRELTLQGVVDRPVPRQPRKTGKLR